MSMPDAIDRLFADAARELSTNTQEMSIHYAPNPVEVMVIEIEKASGYIIMASDELLMDAGVIPDTRSPVHIPWQARLRWRWSAWRERVGRKVGGWIAGVDLGERDDW